MEFEVKVDKDAIEIAVTQAIIDGAIGDRIKEAVEKVLKDSTSSYTYGDKKSGVILSVVERAVGEITRQVFVDEYQERVREAVRARITDEIVDSLIARTFSTWANLR